MADVGRSMAPTDREILTQLFHAAVAIADPETALSPHLPSPPKGRTALPLRIADFLRRKVNPAPDPDDLRLTGNRVTVIASSGRSREAAVVTAAELGLDAHLHTFLSRVKRARSGDSTPR